MNKLNCLYKLGGIRLVMYKLIDIVLHTSYKDEHLYEICKNTNPSDYEKTLKIYYKMKTGAELDLNNPLTFNEKIQWMKLHDTTEKKTMLVDKYLVRKWVASEIGEHYLIKNLGVWERFDDIDFSILPNQFALKCNHGSGWNIVVKDKKSFDFKEAKRKFDKWMSMNFAFVDGFELQYKDVKPLIIAEEYIEELNGNLLDYKIHVFNGTPRIVQVIGDRIIETHSAKEAFFDTEWTPVSDIMYHTYDSYTLLPEKPTNLKEMLNIASILGRDFKYVRVDFYNIADHLLFGEMTFTPMSGFGKWGGYTEKMYSVGSWISI